MVEKEKLEEAARIEAENKKRQLCPEAPTIMPIDKDSMDMKKIKQEDDIYAMPIKEMLKRKYEESVAKKNSNASEAKRVKTEDSSSVSTTITPTDDKLKFVNLPPTKKELKQLNQNKRLEQQHTSTPSTKSDEDNSDEGPNEEPISLRPIDEDQNNQQHSLKKKYKNKNTKSKFNNSGKAHQSSDKPVQTNFDYQKVDFKKFQGGAQKAKGTELKPQFHGKVN